MTSPSETPSVQARSAFCELATRGRRGRRSLWRLPRTRAALAYAEQVHAGQRRQVDGAPFILDPIEVAGLLYNAGAPDRVIAAGVLHDIIEKTAADAADLRARSGLAITKLVVAVSEDEGIAAYAERKAALREHVTRAGHEALMLFAADKISKVRELSLVDIHESRRSLAPARSLSRMSATPRGATDRLPARQTVATADRKPRPAHPAPGTAPTPCPCSSRRSPAAPPGGRPSACSPR
jgi:HD domain